MRRNTSIFVSSVFSDTKDHKDWGFRKQVGEQIARQGYRPWLYEVEIKDRTSDESIVKSNISAAINKADFVLVFFKTRAGGLFNEFSETGTFFEVNEAIRLHVPFKLFVIGEDHSQRLRQFLTFYAKDLVERPNYCADEAAALRQINGSTFVVRSFHKIDPPILTLSNASTDKYHFEEFEQGLVANLRLHRYQDAHELITAYPLPRVRSGLSREQRRFYALALSRIATVYVNRMEFDTAIEYSYRSIRMFLESSEIYEYYAEIERLSGILAMANRPEALWVNFYGYQSTRKFGELHSGYIESRITIYANSGLYDQGLKFLDKDIFLHRSPYHAARYLGMLGHSTIPGALNMARYEMEDRVIPWAAASKDLLAFVLTVAGNLAKLDHDVISARKHLNDAYLQCKLTGAVHTEREVVQLLKDIDEGQNLRRNQKRAADLFKATMKL